MLFLLHLLASVSSKGDFDAFRSFEGLCHVEGYLFESHQVTTQDGYILTLFRIPGKKSEKPKLKPVVLLQHGLLDLADTWITNINPPGFQLADSGFDVWFGNSRGSFHSLDHILYDYTKDKEYWQFTWQHMADFDLPATIDYILSYTSQSKLTYIGHSQGTLQMFAHLSENPDFMQKINIFIALGPVGTVKAVEVPMLRVLMQFPVFEVLKAYKIYEFLPNLKQNFWFYEICKAFGKVCEGIVEFYADMKVDEVDNVERFPVILAHETGGTSIMNMEHWQQMMNYDGWKVQRFDYGEGNFEVYGVERPPVFEFRRIKGPIALFYGRLDRLADLKDVFWIREQLGNAVVYEEELEFGHATFMWGRDMSYFERVIELALEYS